MRIKAGFEFFRSCPYLPHGGPTSNRIGSFIERWDRVLQELFGRRDILCPRPGGGTWFTSIRGGAAGESEKLPCPGVKFLKMIPCSGVKFS